MFSQIPKKAIRKYTLLQIPELLLIVIILYVIHRFWKFPIYYSFVVIALWIVKDIVLLPFVWHAYDSQSDDSEKLIGKLGVTRDRLTPEGQIKLKNEIWKAISINGSDIEKDNVVSIEKIEGLTLYVKKTNAFECPECNNNTLTIEKSLELGPDDDSDEVAIQKIKCRECGFEGLALYKESRRGANECVNHYGYKTTSRRVHRFDRDVKKGMVKKIHYYIHHDTDKMFVMKLR